MPSLPNPLGPYRLDRRLGGGGFADVYLAFDARRGHHVALKVLHPHHANSPEVLRRFQREGEQMLKLRHQHIVGAYEVSQVAGYHTIAMPYLSGGSLADLLAKQKRLNVSVAAAIAGQVAAALDFVHPQVIHRDLKPSNVLLDGQGNCLVADFGVAHVAGESTLTPAGYQPGTPHYMAPEQVRPALGKVSPATDVWALGVILYEMLCGRRPFEAEDSQAVMFQVVNDAPPRPLALNPALPAEMEAILQRALAKDPRQRYQRAGDLGREVARAVGMSGARTPTPTPAPSAPTKLRGAAVVGAAGKRSGRVIMFGGLGGAFGLVLLLLIVMVALRDRTEEPTVVAKTNTPSAVAAAITTTPMIGAAEAMTPTSTLALSTPPTATQAPTSTLAAPAPGTSGRMATLKDPSGRSQVTFLFAAKDDRSGLISILLDGSAEVLVFDLEEGAPTGYKPTGSDIESRMWYRAEYQGQSGWVNCPLVWFIDAQAWASCDENQAVASATSTLASSTAPIAPSVPTATPRSTAPTRTPVRATPPPVPSLTAPLIAAPDDGVTADQGSVRLAWQAAPGATGYRVETRSEREGQQEWKSWPSGGSTELTLNFDDPAIAQYFSIPGTVYEWRVAALDRSGQPGAYSEVRRFVFNRPQPDKPTPPPPSQL